MTITQFSRQLKLLILDEGERLPENELSKLENSDVQVVLIPSADQFEAAFKAASPDVLILSVRDHHQGIRMCHSTRERHHACELPILVLVEEGSQDSVDAYYQAHATEVLAWPSPSTSLYWRVRDQLAVMGTYESLHEKNHFINLAHSSNKIGYWRWDLQHNIFTFTRSLYAFLDIDLQKNFSGVKDFLSFVHPKDLRRLTNIFESASQEVGSYNIEHRMVTQSNQMLIVNHSIKPLYQGEQVHLSGMIQDMTEKRRAEDTIVSLSYYDSLTGLPNREFLLQNLNYTLEYCKRKNKIMALISVGIDNFSRVNSSLGNFKGDRLLSEVAKRMEKTIRGCDLITVSGAPDFDQDNIDENELKLARNLLELPGFDEGEFDDAKNEDRFIGRTQGDNFHIILSDLQKPIDAAVVALRLKKAFETLFDIGGQEVFLSASYGIALYPYNGETPEALMTNADSAQVMAKQSGRDCFRFFSQEFNEGASHRFKLEHDLRYAIEAGEFELFYQPKVDIQNQKLIGAEALMRWNSKERGFVSPAEFIPLSEQTGLIKPIGDWVIEKALSQAKIWQKQIPDFTVAVNVSGVQLNSTFIDSVRTMVASLPSGVNLLDVEITEGVFLDNKELVSEQLEALRESNITISIDDFGTGYSSLSFLRDLPVDTLKIDRSFLRNLDKDEVSRAIVLSVLTLAYGLNLTVVAEGVENQFQLDYLIDHGCHSVQGFLFSKPLSVVDFERWMEEEGWKQHFQQDLSINS